MTHVCRCALVVLAWAVVLAAPSLARPTLVFNGPGVPIPDNSPAGATTQITVPDNVTITGVRARLFFGPNHTFAGDVSANLIGPNAMERLLFHRIGAASMVAPGDSSDLQGPYEFGDAFAGNIWTAAAAAAAGAPIAAGSYRTTGMFSSAPTSLNAPYVGSNSAGVWTLQLIDHAPGDTGGLSLWQLEIDFTGPPAPVTVEWAAPVSGFWNAPNNWNPQVVPNNMGMQEFDAQVLVGGPLYTVTLDVPVTVRNLDLLSGSATLDLNNMPFTVEGDFRLTSTATLQSPFVGSGEFIVNGDAQLSGGTLMWLPNFASNGRLFFVGSVQAVGDAGPTVEMCDSNVGHNGSQMKWSSTAADGGEGVAPTILLNMGSVFTHGPMSEFLIESDAVMNQLSLPSFTSTFNNQGALRKQNSSGLTVFSNFNFNNTGTVEVASGTLRINGVPLPSGALQTGVWIVRAGCTLDFPASNIRTNSADITLDGAASNFQALQTLRTNTASGNLRVRSGRSFVAQPSTLLLSNSGHFRPGPGSVIGVTGDMNLQGAGSVHIGVNGSGISAAHSGKITASGAMSLNGALIVELENGFTPDWGDSYTVATYASRTGNFSSFTAPGVDLTLRWWRENNPTNYRVGVRHIADTNHDNIVNFADLNNVLSTFGQAGAGLIGDTDENGVVNFTDLNNVLGMYGQTAPPN